MKGLRIGLFAGGVFVTGCMVGPNYRPPDVQVPNDYAHSKASAPVAATQPATRPAVASEVVPSAQPVDAWWELLRDPMLDTLVRQSLESNLDLRSAEQRIREARAQRQVITADLWPQLNLGGSHSYRGSSLNAGPKPSSPSLRNQVLTGAVGSVGSALAGAVTGPVAVPANPILAAGQQGAATAIRQGAGVLQSKMSQTSVSRDINLFQAGFDASWELDIFGGTRRAIEAAEGQIQAAEEALRDLQTTLIAEVARNYVEARGYQKRLQIARDNVALQRDTVELTQVKFNAGLIYDLDVAQAEAQLATTESQIPVLETLYWQAVHRLGVLLGREPEAMIAELERVEPIPAVPPQVPIGLPSELLRRRADIRQSERLLAAATAQIGAATADLFPRFSITGSLGTDTRDFRHILDFNSLSWGIGPAVSWPIFDAGRIRANIEVQNARQAQAFYFYRSTILVALEEAEDSLVVYRQEQQRYVQLDRAVQANQRALRVANDRYANGVVSFLSLLVTQLALYNTQDQLVQSEANLASNYIALNKALGGGWQVAPESPTLPTGPVIQAVDYSPALSLILHPPKVE